MLTRLSVRRLKLLQDVEIPLSDSVVFAGPNNFGKTTALQALSIWHLAIQRWLRERGDNRSKAKERTGVPITRKDFTSVPVRTLDLLWSHRAVGKKKNEPRPPLIEIIAEGLDGDNHWTCGMELQYAMPELLYCRPIDGLEIPIEARETKVVHVPPLGGIKTEEEKRERGIQDLIIGEGRPGEILRNLLYQISVNSPDSWSKLANDIQDTFNFELIKPSFSGTYITCEYASPSSSANRKPKPLDIANAGSGFHQVLLLLAFFYARPGSVLLLDEPDAHLHVILQRDIYALLKRAASERGSQLIISTHSEVILDETDPTRIVAFTGPKPHLLVNTSQRAQLKRALTKLKSLDFLLADQIGSVLYVEGETDASILREWARILDHPAYHFLARPFIHPIGGNDRMNAVQHFCALREAYPHLKAVAVLDRNDKEAPSDLFPFYHWERREIENYLLVPSTIERFVEDRAPLRALARPFVVRSFAKQAPANFSPFDDSIVFLRDVKASEDFLLPLMAEVGLSTSKSDLFLIAAAMRPNEIHPHVKKALDLIAMLSVSPPIACHEVADEGDCGEAVENEEGADEG